MLRTRAPARQADKISSLAEPPTSWRCVRWGGGGGGEAQNQWIFFSGFSIQKRVMSIWRLSHRAVQNTGCLDAGWGLETANIQRQHQHRFTESAATPVCKRTVSSAFAQVSYAHFGDPLATQVPPATNADRRTMEVAGFVSSNGQWPAPMRHQTVQLVRES